MIGRQAAAKSIPSRRAVPTAWLLALTALGAAATALIAGYWQTPPGYSYHGFVMLGEDGSEFLAAIRQGAQGFLLYRDQFTTLPAPPILMYPVYMLAGHLLAPLHLDPLVVFNALHVAAAIGLVATLWSFARTFAPRHATIAYALILFGGSLALIPIVASSGRALLPYLTSELGTMQTLLFSVHASAGLAAQALSLVVYRRMRGLHRDIALMATLGLLGCTYPFNLPVMLAALVADTLWRMLETRQLTRDAVVLLVIITPTVALIPVYYWLVFHAIPYWRASTFLHMSIAQPSVLPWTFGLLAVLALPNLWARSNRPLLLWLLVAVILIVTNIAQPPRLLAGLWLPLAVLAADTLGRLRIRSLRLLAICGLSTSGILTPFMLSTVIAQNPGHYPIVQPVAVDEVGHYLAAHTSATDVVLADYEVSNMLVGEAPIHVVAGHVFQTLDLATAALAQQRYLTASAYERHTIEHHYGITYLVIATTQRGLLRAVSHDSTYRKVYTNNGYCVYRTGITTTPRSTSGPDMR